MTFDPSRFKPAMNSFESSSRRSAPPATTNVFGKPLNRPSGPGFTKRDTGEMYLFVHYPPRKQDFATITLDASAWHTYAVELARDHVTWFVDGVPKITDRNAGAVPTTPLALNVQLDANSARPAPGTLQLDWARYYPLPDDGAVPAPSAPAPQTGDYG